jgi:hypothetical protein
VATIPCDSSTSSLLKYLNSDSGNVLEEDVPPVDINKVIDLGVTNLQRVILNSDRDTKIVKVSYYGLHPQSYLRFPQTPVLPVRLTSDPKSLAILITLSKPANLSTEDHILQQGLRSN